MGKRKAGGSDHMVFDLLQEWTFGKFEVAEGEGKIRSKGSNGVMSSQTLFLSLHCRVSHFLGRSELRGREVISRVLDSNRRRLIGGDYSLRKGVA